MDKFRIPIKFVKMMKVFFQGANLNIVMNGKTSKALVIKKGVQQGCPLASYLFLIMEENLNAKIYEEQRLGRIESIRLPVSNRRQIITQYVDDTSFTLEASREGMIWLTQLLDLFNITFGLKINHAKSIAFWMGGIKESRST